MSSAPLFSDIFTIYHVNSFSPIPGNLKLVAMILVCIVVRLPVAIPPCTMILCPLLIQMWLLSDTNMMCEMCSLMHENYRNCVFTCLMMCEMCSLMHEMCLLKHDGFSADLQQVLALPVEYISLSYYNERLISNKQSGHSSSLPSLLGHACIV